MAESYKRFSELAQDNPSGMDCIDNPHCFSSNPGFFGPATRPSTRSQQPVIGSGNTVGRSANRGFGSVANPAPGSIDPTSDMGPQVMTSGYGA